MAEQQINKRKSQMFLHSIIPVVDTHEDLIKKKLKRGKFTFTITGILKIIEIIFLLIAILIFLSNTKCINTPNWYDYLLPCTFGIHLFISFLLYLIFSLGLTVHNPGNWVLLDIILNLILSIVTIIAAALTMTSCIISSSLQNIPTIMGFCGGGCSILSCAALFLLYRYKEDVSEDIIANIRTQQADDSRKSIFA